MQIIKGEGNIIENDIITISLTFSSTKDSEIAWRQLGNTWKVSTNPKTLLWTGSKEEYNFTKLNLINHEVDPIEFNSENFSIYFKNIIVNNQQLCLF